MTLIAAEALALAGDAKAVQRFEELKANKDRTSKKLNTFSEIQSENMCTRLVDNFLSYVSESLQAALLKRPEMLRSSEMVRLDDVLRFRNYKNLVSFLADRKLNELTYGGLQGIEDFLEERTGLSLAVDNDQRSTLKIAIELRNIYTHNRGVVNELFLKRISKVKHEFQFYEGKRFHADLDALAILANDIFEVAKSFDERVARKFRMKRKKYQKNSS